MFSLSDILLDTHREYLRCLTSIGHTRRILSLSDILLATCGEYSCCLTSDGPIADCGGRAGADGAIYGVGRVHHDRRERSTQEGPQAFSHAPIWHQGKAIPSAIHFWCMLLVPRTIHFRPQGKLINAGGM